MLSQNRYSVLEVEHYESNNTIPVIDMRNNSEPSPAALKRLHHPAWERRLLCEFKISATPSDNSLAIDIKLESTDSGVKRRTSALVDCGTTALFIDEDYI